MLQLTHDRNLTLQRLGPDGRFSVVATVQQPQFKAKHAHSGANKVAGCRVLLGDFDGDGESLEVLTCPDGAAQSEAWLFDSVAAMMNNPDKPRSRLKARRGVIAPVATADLNNDGYLDAVAVELYDGWESDGALHVLENDGAGKLTIAKTCAAAAFSLHSRRPVPRHRASRATLRRSRAWQVQPQLRPDGLDGVRDRTDGSGGRH